MQIKSYKKIKYLIGCLIPIVTIFGMSNSTDATGHQLSILEAIFMAIFIYGLNTIACSDWMYTEVTNDNIKISYLTYQKIGIFISICFLVMISASAYVGHGYGSIPVLYGIVVAIILYLIIIKSIQIIEE